MVKINKSQSIPLELKSMINYAIAVVVNKNQSIRLLFKSMSHYVIAVPTYNLDK